jgi:hypothetical protein
MTDFIIVPKFRSEGERIVFKIPNGKRTLDKHLINCNFKFKKDDKSERYLGKFLPYLFGIKRTWLGKLFPSQENSSKFQT